MSIRRNTGKSITLLTALLLPCAGAASELQVEEPEQNPPLREQAEQEKLADDPTKVISKVGFGYTDQLFISGSLGLDKARKLNVRISEGADEWRVGGSWLFKLGIVNVSFGRTEYEHGASQKHYSIGSFVPLSVFGFSPLGWQIFPQAGYNHNDGDIAVENQDPEIESDFVLLPSTTNGGYVGGFALKPLSEHWNLLTFGGGSMGSDDYSGFWLGGGFSCEINQHNSFNVFGFASDNSFGENQKIGASYTYQFK